MSSVMMRRFVSSSSSSDDISEVYVDTGTDAVDNQAFLSHIGCEARQQQARTKPVLMTSITDVEGERVTIWKNIL